MEFLSSKQLSSFCFFVNIIFFVWMVSSGEYVFSLLPLIAGSVCLSNILR